MKWTNKGHELDGMGDILLNPANEYYIWGAGTFGIAFWERFHTSFRISAFIDRNPNKQGAKCCGLDVLSPTEFKEVRKNEIVLVSTGLTASAYDTLDAMGFVRFRDYFHIDEAASIYEFKKHGRVYVNDLTIQITRKCSLKCQYCNAFIPLVKEKIDFSLEEIKQELNHYFCWVDEVNIFGMSGGDAMMHRDFADILEWVGETYYPKRMNHIELYCNAVILPSDRILDLMAKYKVIYRFTDYHGNAGRQRIEEVEALLKERGIAFDHANLQSWYDSGYPQESNGIESEEGLIAFCTRCDRKSCHGLWGDRLFTCGICKNAADIEYCDVLADDYFDIGTYREERRAELLEYYLGYSNRGYYNYCRKCNGGMNVNTHAILAGEQAT